MGDAGGDDDDVAGLGIGVGAGADFAEGRRNGERIAKIHDFALGVGGVDVGENDFVDGGALVN